MAAAGSVGGGAHPGRLWFDPATLRKLAGNGAFQRGEEYYRDGAVTLLSVEPSRVLAEVAGTEDYRTELSLQRSRIEGSCSCRAFEDWGFCKHMVAVALAANAASGAGEEIGLLARIRKHLEGMKPDALVGMIIEQAEQDPVLFRRLELASAAIGADDKTVESRLRRTIDAATRTDNYVPYREVAGWASGIEQALNAVDDLVASRAGLALKLAEHAIDRIEAAIEGVDDSDGSCGGLLHRAREVHLEACLAARPDPVPLARDLFAREVEGEYDTFNGSAAAYADVLGEAGLAEYRRLASEAWNKLPARNGRGAFTTDYSRLMEILDFFAERDGDVEAQIALRAKDLSSPWSYLKLAEFCLAHGREEDALRRAEEGLWMFEDDRPDTRLVFFAVDLLVKAGRSAEAEKHVWRTFEKAPSLEVYARLCKLGGSPARSRALAFLEERIGKEERTPWYHPADLTLHILTSEKQYDAAWAVARTHSTSIGAREALARVSEATHPRDAAEVYASRIEDLVRGGTNSGYAEAAQLVGRMAKLRDKGEQADYIAGLKARHGRKRNFMKLLG